MAGAKHAGTMVWHYCRPTTSLASSRWAQILPTGLPRGQQRTGPQCSGPVWPGTSPAVHTGDGEHARADDALQPAVTPGPAL